MAFAIPKVAAVKVTSKVVGVIFVIGVPVPLKSNPNCESKPKLNAIPDPVKLRFPPPVFWIVNVLVKEEPILTSPKSVWSAKSGVMSPSTISIVFPCKLTSGPATVPFAVIANVYDCSAASGSSVETFTVAFAIPNVAAVKVTSKVVGVIFVIGEPVHLNLIQIVNQNQN